MSREENQINNLMEAIHTSSVILCSKCNAHATFQGDEIESAHYFRKKGWYATEYNIYCPKCYKAPYKKKQAKKKKAITVNTTHPKSKFFAASAFTSFNPVVYTKPDTRMKIGTKKKKPGPITGTTY